MRVFAIQEPRVFPSPPSQPSQGPSTGCGTAMAGSLQLAGVCCRAQLGQRRVFCRTQQQELGGEVATADIPQQPSHSHHPMLATHWQPTRNTSHKRLAKMLIFSVVSQINIKPFKSRLSFYQAVVYSSDQSPGLRQARWHQGTGLWDTAAAHVATGEGSSPLATDWSTPQYPCEDHPAP